MLRGLITPRQIMARLKVSAPQKIDKRQAMAAVFLAAVGLGVMGWMVSSRQVGPRITVQEPAVAERLAEPAPLEKPVGASTAPQGGGVAEQAEKEEPAAGASAEPQSRLSGEAAPAALARLAWPVVGRVIRGYGYGFVAAYQDYRFHPGLDVAAPVDMPVRAAADGRVKELAYDAEHRWQVVLEHGSGWETAYLELGRVADLSVGTWVKAGELLGYLAEPGRAAESQVPHLHFEVRYRGEARNPLEFLPPGF